MPHRKSLSSIWRRIPQRYRGESTKCLSCGKHFFPPRSFCPTCRRKSEIAPYTPSGKGIVYSYTVNHVAQEGFAAEVPYIIAIIELEEGARLTAQLCDTGSESVEIGMPVEVVLRKVCEAGSDGIIHYAYKFTPISERKR